MGLNRTLREILLANRIDNGIISSMKYLSKGLYSTEENAFRALGHMRDLIGAAEQYNSSGFAPRIDADGYRAAQREISDGLESRFPRHHSVLPSGRDASSYLLERER